MVGYLCFSFEYSDWRGGNYIWIQGLEVDATKLAQERAKILQTLKATYDANADSLRYTVSGIRFQSPKELHE